MLRRLRTSGMRSCIRYSCFQSKREGMGEENHVDLTNEEDEETVAMSQDSVGMSQDTVPMSQDTVLMSQDVDDLNVGLESDSEEEEERDRAETKRQKLDPLGGMWNNRGVRPVKVIWFPDSTDTVFAISRGNIVKFTGDAIVNAANEACLGGGGVDGAISSAGGQQLKEARKALPYVPNTKKRCLTGNAVVTIGGQLPAKYCIHAVGPNYSTCTEERGDEILASTYKNAMMRAKEKNVKSLCFSLISSGIFRGGKSLRSVLRIGCEAVLTSHYEGLEEVHFLAFSDKEELVLKEILDAREQLSFETS